MKCVQVLTELRTGLSNTILKAIFGIDKSSCISKIFKKKVPNMFFKENITNSVYKGWPLVKPIMVVASDDPLTSLARTL